MNKAEKTTPKSGNDRQNGDKIPQSKSKKPKTAKDLMTSHITDKNHVITDEEFKNVSTDVTLDVDTAHEPLEIENKKDRPKDEGKDHPYTTPWDVLDE